MCFAGIEQPVDSMRPVTLGPLRASSRWQRFQRRPIVGALAFLTILVSAMMIADALAR